MKFKMLSDRQDINDLMKRFGYFHDSCIKEIKYVSGGYVGSDNAMYPFNSKRCLNIIFQSQNAECPVIELKFNLIRKLNLVPNPEEYDCIIYEASLEIVDNLFYWCEWGDFKLEDLNKVNGTWVCAAEVMWREIPNALGEDEIFSYSI